MLGVGDDAALLQPTAGKVLAVSTDMLVSGTHFFPRCRSLPAGPQDAGGEPVRPRGDGALPRWATLAISLPAADEAWLERFSAGFLRAGATTRRRTGRRRHDARAAETCA